MAFSNVTIGSNAAVIPVDTRVIRKVVFLPSANTNAGRYLLFKDYYGTSSNSSFTISTTGTDLIDDYNFKYTFSNAFGAMSFVSDGIRSWRTMDFYNGALTPAAAATIVIVSRGLIQNLDAATYTSGSTWTALVGNNDTLYNTPTTTTAPGGQTVLVFNGSSQYAMDQTGTSATTTFSFDIWFYAAADGNVVSEMGQAGAANSGYHVATFQLVSGAIRVGFWTGGAATSISLGAYTANKWTQVSWTYTGGTLTGYVNGVFAATGSQTKSAPTTSFYAIAASENTSFGNSSFFNGRIGAYKLYNVVLTALEVKQNYNAFASSRFGLPSI